MKKKLIITLALAAALTVLSVIVVSAVSGAAFTTFNAHVDGATKDVCKNSAINCNIYGAKEYVWLNGGPTANGLGPDGQYFFAVLVPGGQPNPNDGGVKNLSDDYDEYTNRTFTVTGGEVSAYAGKHWLDSGKKEPGGPDEKPNGKIPYIRLFPYADTTNPGGVYIMAICSLDRGYPVEPRDCKYDAFKVKKQMTISFDLYGMKFLDVNGDADKTGDPGLAGWKIIISGKGPDGQPIYIEKTTDEFGYWSYQSGEYKFSGSQKPVDVALTVCEELKAGWTQTFPGGDGCHDIAFTPTGFDSFFDIDFGNGNPVIDVEKTCEAVVKFGNPVKYGFDVENTGNVILVNVDVNDPTVGFDNDPNISLPPGGSQHYDWSFTPTAPTIINNTVYASGDYGATPVFATVNDKDSCTTRVVDARISIWESGKNGITESHPFTVKVEKNDGSGWVPAAGVVVTVNESGVGYIQSETCSGPGGTDVNGQCTVTVNSNVAGDSFVNASAIVNVEGENIAVATNGYGAFKVSNQKTWVAGSLSWRKYDNADRLLGGATFEVCRTYDRFGIDIVPDECVTVKDNTAPDADADKGEFLLTGLKLGRYTIEETVPPVGFEGDLFVETLELTLTAPDAAATYKWVNYPYEGCTPGFWQGGNDFGTAGGKWLWNTLPDPQWAGTFSQPFYWDTLFGLKFAGYPYPTHTTYMLIDGGGGSDIYEKVGRDMVAAYLNSSWGMNYPYTTAQLDALWTSAVASGDFAALHTLLGAANESMADTNGDGIGDTHMCPISASIP